MKNFITINSIQNRLAKGVPLGRVSETTARKLWWAALDTLQDEILLNQNLSGGIWLSSPLPALYEPYILNALRGWVWAPEGLENLKLPKAGLLPPSKARSIENSELKEFHRLPLYPEDGNDPLLIILTSEIQIALSLHGRAGERTLLMRSDKESIKDVLLMIQERLNFQEISESEKLQNSIKYFYENNFQTIDIANIFWPLLSEKLAGFSTSLNIQTHNTVAKNSDSFDERNIQISLLEAITHEVRTPLATIRTLIRSLLKRNDITETVNKRLRQIDSECTEQIDRFGLIFKAAEFERKQSSKSGLARTDLGNMLETMFPVWQQQLDRRGLLLKLIIAKDLPQVLSDPEQLELMLGGLIDRNTRGLQAGSTLVLELNPAGQRLKLQIFSNSQNEFSNNDFEDEQKAQFGNVLSWNPVTGSLQLSQAATQRFLASLGGRLTHRRERGLIIFFPVAEAK